MTEGHIPPWIIIAFDVSILTIFGIILLALGTEVIREGVDINNKFKPRYKTHVGDKEVLVGIFIFLAGISIIIASVVWIFGNLS